MYKFLDLTKLHYFTSLFMLFAFLSIQDAFSTHIRAGEITAIRQPGSALTYCFVITIYVDTDSQADSPDLLVNFGDGSDATSVLRTSQADIMGTETRVYFYETCHTYAASGVFLVTLTEENRNAGVLNMSNSVNTPFSVETQIIIDPSLGLNATPNFNVPPIDVACVGQRFIHNPGAFDLDGDSISFRLYTPKQDRSAFVNGYQDPNQIGGPGEQEDGTVPALFSIDPITGDLVWDSPAVPGEYNVAFFVEEWRNGVRIGYVVRDMQIIVEDCPNIRPSIEAEGGCFAVDSPGEDPVLINITASDPDIDPIQNVTITSDNTQAVYDPAIFNTVATFTAGMPSNPNAATFEWDIDCEHVREQPYIVVFKAEDEPPPPSNSLTDIASILITIVAPQPTGLTATTSGRGVDLTWDAYTSCSEAETMKIWRREGCDDADYCTEAELLAAGYTVIGEVPIGQTTFRDNGPLSRGLDYTYRLSAAFPAPKGGASKPSNNECARLPLIAPLITNVHIENTSTSTGEVTIQWLPPLELNLTADATGYEYRVYRTTGFDGTFGISPIATVATSNPPNTPLSGASTEADTDFLSFTDTGLDTQSTIYLYKIELRALSNDELVGDEPSDSASTVRLTVEPDDNRYAILTWEYNVSWSNQNQEHIIFRKASDETNFSEIGRILVGERRYRDGCLNPDLTYTYRVRTIGSYGSEIVDNVLDDEVSGNVLLDVVDSKPVYLNDTQEEEVRPLDLTPPPPPVLSLSPVDCATAFSNDLIIQDETTCDLPPLGDLTNELVWEEGTSSDPCDDDAVAYRIYYNATNDSIPANFTQIGSVDVPTQTFTDINARPNPATQAGCYFVTAVDRFGNESLPSNIVCQENCINFELPNIITPNNDSKNDVLRPMPNPRFVEAVEFEVFNRWGNSVFKVDDCPMINWDGTNNAGKDLPTGMYYYVAKVRFITLDPANANQEFKGWLNIMK